MPPRTFYFLLPLTFLATAPVLGADAPVACAQKSVVASAVRTPEDIQAFVQCAYEFVQEVGFAQARQAFNEDERWKSGSTYLFVAEVAPLDQARFFVFPPDPSREDAPFGPLVDAFGNDFFSEGQRIVNNFGEGWLYYSFTNPATGQDEPKASYIKSIDWGGKPGGDRRWDLPPRYSRHLLE